MSKATAFARFTINIGEDDLAEGPLRPVACAARAAAVSSLASDLKRLAEYAMLGSSMQPLP